MKSSNLRPCWIKPNGEVILCINWNDHLHEAAKAFPDTDLPPEGAAVDAGWLKVFRCDDSMCFVGGNLTTSQRREIEKYDLDADDVEDQAIQNRNFWRRQNHCSA